MQTTTTIAIPIWFVLTVGMPATALACRSEFRRRRNRINHCIKCGYDLAGLNSNAACPECSTMREPFST